MKEQNRGQLTCQTLHEFLLALFYRACIKTNAAHLNKHGCNTHWHAKPRIGSSAEASSVHRFRLNLCCEVLRKRSSLFRRKYEENKNKTTSHTSPSCEILVVQLQRRRRRRCKASAQLYAICTAPSQVQVYTPYLKLLILISLSPTLRLQLFLRCPSHSAPALKEQYGLAAVRLADV